MPPSPHISILPPPGPSVLKLYPPSLSQPTVPALFLDAYAIRTAVFNVEQHCSAELEIDADDPRSWHWVAFAASREPDGSRARATDLGGEDTAAAATIRLMPVSPPSPDGDGSAVPHVEGPSHHPTQMWDGHEPYITLGRLATLSAYRGLGLGRLLVSTAFEWAVENAAALRATENLTAREKKQEEGAEQHEGGGKEENDGDGKGTGWNGLVFIHAQVEVESFYNRLGFVTDPGMGRWYEEGIEHVAMWRRLELR